MTVEDPTKKQIQEVDPEVAKILGLEDNFDLEYDEYLTLLKEALVKYAVIGKEKDSAEKAQVLNEERKRIKGLKGSKFTAPKKTVNTDSFFGRKKEETTQKPITDTSKLLPGTVGAGPIQKYNPPEEPKQEEEKKDDTSDKLKEIDNFLNGSLLGIVKEIRGLTEDILSILQKQFSAEKKGAELFRRESEKKGKVGKEKELESKEEKKGLGLVEKITKPFTSIFDTIKNFITMVLLGSLVNWLFSVIENPMILLKPIQGLIDGIVGFFNNIINFIDNLVVQPVRNFIDTINSALNGFIDILNGALKMLPGSPQIGPANIPNIPEPPQIEAPNITGEKKPAEPPKGPPVNLKFTGGSIGPTTQVIQKVNAGGISAKKGDRDKFSFNDKVSKEGGSVNSSTTSFDISGLGPDKYLTALSQDEYVLKPGAADWLGGPVYLDKINQMFGGSTSRKTANLGDINIKAMNSGGQVGRPPSSSSLPMGGGAGPRATTPSPAGASTPAPNGSFKVNNKIFSPNQYIENTKSTKHIEVGKNPAKSYVLRYKRQGASGTYIIKQINKVVTSAGFGRLFGGQDNLTGVLPSSPEGKSVLDSTNVKQVFAEQTAKSLKLNLKVDEDADIFYWYNQAYQTHYTDWKKNKNVTEEYRRQASASAAAEFAISKSKGSWLPGSKPGAPEQLKTQAVESDNITTPSSSSPSSSGSPSSQSSSQLTPDKLALANKNVIRGDLASDSYVKYLSSTATPAPASPAPVSSGSGSAGPKGGGRGGPKPRSNDIGYRMGRGFMGALGDLGPGLLLQLQGKDGPALQRQRERGRKAVQLFTTGKFSEKPSSSKPTPTPQKPLIDPKTGRNVFDGMPASSVPARSASTTSASTKSAPIRSVSTGSATSSSPSTSSPDKSITTSSTTSSSANSPVAAKIAGGMEIYNKQKTSGDIKGAQDTAKSVWALANPTLAAAAAERERISGTKQTDNPLMKSMKSNLAMNSPSIQSLDISKLGKGFQSLVENPNAFKGANIIAPPKSEVKYESGTKIKSGEAGQYSSTSQQNNEGNDKSLGKATSPTLPTSTPTSSIIPPAPILPPPAQLNQDLNQMSIEQLSKMLDPTVTGASNPAVFQAATKAREEGKAQGLIGEALEKRVLMATIEAKQGSLSPATAPAPAPSPIAPSSITATSKPNIPQPPSTQPNVSMLPLPPMGQSNKPAAAGMTKTGTTPTVHFNSYNDSESAIVTTAALYNIWGM